MYSNVKYFWRGLWLLRKISVRAIRCLALHPRCWITETLRNVQPVPARAVGTGVELRAMGSYLVFSHQATDLDPRRRGAAAPKARDAEGVGTKWGKELDMVERSEPGCR